MNNYAVIALFGLVVFGSYAGDAYDVLYPHETMQPWRSTKGELELREKDWKNSRKPFKDKLWLNRPNWNLLTQKERAEASDAFWNFQKADQQAFHNYYNAYYSQPTFPRIERFRDRLSHWIGSWYR